MFLRSITIRGFKSFADKTVLEFIPGVSVIVGPNGSGKSNLVDAISWVLGEQGARSLRGGNMADVIFAGTPSRPALGMAEVKLVIDNSAGRIPVPMSEIEVARTIFRSGESEYRINGQVVRLLDVQELLSETGIGRALHTVVGQGQLEEVLHAKPEDRRRYIEEAAGIAKHRRRKERAERKLANLDHDLLRLGDVLSELRRQLKPLQQQAEMAKQARDAHRRGRDACRATLAAARLRALLREKDRRAEGWQRGLDERSAARERLDALDGEVLAAADARAMASTGACRRRARVPKNGRRAAHGQSSRSAKPSSARARRGSNWHPRPRGPPGSTRSTTRSRVSRQISRASSASSRRASASSRKPSGRSARRSRSGIAVEELRRRAGEDAAGRRAEVEALERSLAHERARARAPRRLAGRGARTASPKPTPSERASRPRSRRSTTSPRR